MNLLFHEVTQRKPSCGLAPSRVRWNAAHWKRVRFAGVLDGEVAPQIDLGIEAARMRQEHVLARALELGAHDRRLGVVGDRACA